MLFSLKERRLILGLLVMLRYMRRLGHSHWMLVRFPWCHAVFPQGKFVPLFWCEHLPNALFTTYLFHWISFRAIIAFRCNEWNEYISENTLNALGMIKIWIKRTLNAFMKLSRHKQDHVQIHCFWWRYFWLWCWYWYKQEQNQVLGVFQSLEGHHA